MANPWGDVGDDDDYGDDFGSGYGGGSSGGTGSGYGGAPEQDQVQERSTDDYLKEAIGNLQETEDMGEEGLAHLAAQREVLDNIRKNVDRMDNTLDVADRKITEMENPWAIGAVKTKGSGAHSRHAGPIGESEYVNGAGFQMKGYVMKRARIFKNWNKRYFKQVGDSIEYFLTESDTKLRGKIVLKGATLNRISYDQKDSNGAVCKLDNCFEIIVAGQTKGDTIHVEEKGDYNTWIACIERVIHPERFQRKSEAAYSRGDVPAAAGSAHRSGVGFGNEQQDAMLNTIMDKLDNVDGMARMMGAEVEDQTKIIQNLTDDMDRLDGRVNVNKDRVTRIK